jgi:hypothetical protein
MKKIILILIIALSCNTYSNEWYIQKDIDIYKKDTFKLNSLDITSKNHIIINSDLGVFVNNWKDLKADWRFKEAAYESVFFNDNLFVVMKHMGILLFDTNYYCTSIQIPKGKGYNLPSWKVFSLINDGNTMWVATDSGVCKREKFDTIKNFFKNDSNWVYFNKSNTNLPSNTILTIDVKPNDHSIWMICDSASHRTAIKFQNGNITNYNSNNSLIPHDSITCLTIDSSYNVWCGTGNGLAKLDNTLQTWTLFTKSNSSLPSDLITALHTDKWGNLWIGSDQAITKYDGTNWITYTNSDYLFGNIKSIVVDTFNNKWILSQKHLTIFREGGIVGSFVFHNLDTSIHPTDVENSQPSNNSNYSFSISPNPASDYIEISLDSPSIKRGQGGVSYEIFNIFGEVQDAPPQTPPLEGRGLKIDISNLAPGVYFIRIGDRFEKFIKM